MEVRAEGTRRRVKPRLRWRMEGVKEDLRERGLKSDESVNRTEWRYLARNVGPAY